MGNVNVTYREYVCDIFGPASGFGNQTFALNPGIDTTFPFLSQLAANYEEYTLRQCMFTYKSNIAPIGASTTGQVGEVIMATNYNASAPAYTDKQTMLQSALSMSARATEDMIHGVECDPAKLSMAVGKYVRVGPVGPDEDVKTYDHGTLNVAVSGIPAAYQNQAIGELWVAYTVQLRKPRKYTSLGYGISRDVFVQPAVTTAGTLWSQPILKGIQNRIDCQVTQTPGSPNFTITFPGTFSGDVTLRLAVGLPTPIPPIQWDSISTTGEVTGIKDLLLSVGGVTPATWWGTYQGTGGGGVVPSIATLEVHLRIKLAANGIDNTVTIGLTTGLPAQVTNFAMLDIFEYNTLFNFESNGTNDRVILVNDAGVVVNIP